MRDNKDTPSHRLAKLVEELSMHGYALAEKKKHLAVIRDLQNDEAFILTVSDAWIRAMQPVVEAASLEAPSRNAVLELVLRLHSRYLGCHFGFDDDENLTIQYDVYPGMSGKHVAQVLAQMRYVRSATSALFEEALAGDVIDESRIDAVFIDAHSN